MNGKTMTRHEFAALNLVGRIGEIALGNTVWRARIKEVDGSGSSHELLEVRFEKSSQIWEGHYEDFRNREKWMWEKKKEHCSAFNSHSINGNENEIPIETLADGTIVVPLFQYGMRMFIRPEGEELDPTKKA